VGYFGHGEKLAAPIAFCSRGGRVVAMSGPGLMALAVIAADLQEGR
jgi:hypothetical protein